MANRKRVRREVPLFTNLLTAHNEDRTLESSHFFESRPRPLRPGCLILRVALVDPSLSRPNQCRTRYILRGCIFSCSFFGQRYTILWMFIVVPMEWAHGGVPMRCKHAMGQPAWPSGGWTHGGTTQGRQHARPWWRLAATGWDADIGAYPETKMDETIPRVVTAHGSSSSEAHWMTTMT